MMRWCVYIAAGSFRRDSTSARQSISLVHSAARQSRRLRLHVDHCNYITSSRNLLNSSHQALEEEEKDIYLAQTV